MDDGVDGRYPIDCTPTGAPVVLIMVDKNHIDHALNDSERM